MAVYNLCGGLDELGWFNYGKSEEELTMTVSCLSHNNDQDKVNKTTSCRHKTHDCILMRSASRAKVGIKTINAREHFGDHFVLFLR